MHKYILNLLFTFFLTFCLSANGYSGNGSENEKKSSSERTLQNLLIKVLKNHEEIKKFQSQVDQANAQYSKTRGLYYPTMDLIVEGGREDIDKEYGIDTNKDRYTATLRTNQLLTDFGKTENEIARSGVLLDQAKARLESSRQQLMLEGIIAYINIIRARDQLYSARYSEDRIKELTGIEKTLVEKQAGLSSDVLQAKSQLAGAMALRVEAEGALSIAKNRFQAVFYQALNNTEVQLFKDIEFPYKNLPLELEEAVNIAQKLNPELMITLYDTQIARKDIAIAKTAFYPRFHLFAEAMRKNNDDGARGYSNEFSGGLEFRYNIFNGGSDEAALQEALDSEKAAAYHTKYVRKIIREQVSNSWSQLSNLKQRSDLLDQQAEIVKNFLQLAKKELKMGTRSLLDVLNGEVNYINSTATSIAARQDTKIAAYNLLFAMGNINLQLFE